MFRSSSLLEIKSKLVKSWRFVEGAVPELEERNKPANCFWKIAAS
jgi:hypothetical protein